MERIDFPTLRAKFEYLNGLAGHYGDELALLDVARAAHTLVERTAYLEGDKAGDAHLELVDALDKFTFA